MSNVYGQTFITRRTGVCLRQRATDWGRELAESTGGGPLDKGIFRNVESTFQYSSLLLLFRGFGGAMVSMLNCCLQDCGFKPGRSLRIFL